MQSKKLIIVGNTVSTQSILYSKLTEQEKIKEEDVTQFLAIVLHEIKYKLWYIPNLRNPGAFKETDMALLCLDSADKKSFGILEEYKQTISNENNNCHFILVNFSPTHSHEPLFQDFIKRQEIKHFVTIDCKNHQQITDLLNTCHQVMYPSENFKSSKTKETSSNPVEISTDSNSIDFSYTDLSYLYIPATLLLEFLIVALAAITLTLLFPSAMIPIISAAVGLFIFIALSTVAIALSVNNSEAAPLVTYSKSGFFDRSPYDPKEPLLNDNLSCAKWRLLF